MRSLWIFLHHLGFPFVTKKAFQKNIAKTDISKVYIETDNTFCKILLFIKQKHTEEKKNTEKSAKQAMECSNSKSSF